LDLNLLEKTELRIDGLVTMGTNLTDLATVIAGVLSLPADKVMVIDVRPGQLAVDILVPTVKAEAVFGKKQALLRSLAAIPGVMLAPDADVHSEGILGAIALDEADASAALAASEAIADDIAAHRKARVRIFPTGFELVESRIEDTNTPYLVKVFAQAGYLSEAGSALADNRDQLVDALRTAAHECGLVVTTGGVGAEDKDFSVEAIEALDPNAATPYLVHFNKGEGRHVKDGVRIGVGSLNGCLLVALPGPHDEVRLAVPVLLEGYKQRLSKAELGGRLAEALREKFRAVAKRHGHQGYSGHRHQKAAEAHE
jgi:molybdenum cofactor synthesis domain-containing protein